MEMRVERLELPSHVDPNSTIIGCQKSYVPFVDRHMHVHFSVQQADIPSREPTRAAQRHTTTCTSTLTFTSGFASCSYTSCRARRWWCSPRRSAAPCRKPSDVDSSFCSSIGARNSFVCRFVIATKSYRLKMVVIWLLWEVHLRVTERYLPYGITYRHPIR